MLSSPRTGAFVIVVFSERERFKSAEINQMPYVCNTPGITESFRPSFCSPASVVSTPHLTVWIPFRRPVYSTREDLWSPGGDTIGKYDSALEIIICTGMYVPLRLCISDLHGKRALGYEPTLHGPKVQPREILSGLEHK
jgi:hypothetical protein